MDYLGFAIGFGPQASFTNKSAQHHLFTYPNVHLFHTLNARKSWVSQQVSSTLTESAKAQKLRSQPREKRCHGFYLDYLGGNLERLTIALGTSLARRLRGEMSVTEYLHETVSSPMRAVSETLRP